MAALTFVPGYLAEVKVGADQLESDLLSGTLVRTKNVMHVPVAGEQSPTTIAGQINGTISVSGVVSTDDMAKWQTAFASNAKLAFVWGIGNTTGSPDAGEYTGFMLVESLATEFAADDKWTLSVDCVITEGATYVAPV